MYVACLSLWLISAISRQRLISKIIVVIYRKINRQPTYTTHSNIVVYTQSLQWLIQIMIFLYKEAAYQGQLRNGLSLFLYRKTTRRPYFRQLPSSSSSFLLRCRDQNSIPRLLQFQQIVSQASNRSTDAWRNIPEDLNLPMYYCPTCTRNLASHTQRRIQFSHPEKDIVRLLNTSGFGILGTVLAFIRSPDFIHRLMRRFEKRSVSACLKCEEVPAQLGPVESPVM